tara:strand:- start:784 stop:1176 length:393 start_codon:yes stop_codon:yes gene_type:complete
MNSQIPKEKLRQFGFLIGLGFPILIGWILPSMSGHLFRSWTLWVGLASIFFGIFKPRLLLYPYKFWISLGNTLGWINSHIILGLVFLLILQPIALIMKVFGYDPLKQKRTEEDSYREKKDGYTVDLTKIF